MTTLDDVAKKAGVSRMTASNALRGKRSVRESTAEKVLEAAKALHYQPNLAARSLANGKTNMIGFSTVELDHSPFSVRLAAAISDEALNSGYQTMIQQTRHSQQYESTMFSDPYTQICEGTIFSAPTLPAEHIKSLSERYPLVAFDAPALTGEIDTVLSPYERGSRAAVDHLIDQGARRVLILGANYQTESMLEHTLTLDGLRLKGAVKALRRRGLPYDRSSVIRCEWNYEAAFTAMTDRLGGVDSGLDRHPDFDAVYCTTDVIAIGAVRAMDQAGIPVPDEVKVIGFDGLAETQYSNPPISTIAMDARQVAKECVDLLLRRIRFAKAEVESRVVPFTLVERKSSMHT